MNIKRILKQKNVTIVELAKKLGITQQRMTAIINSNDVKLSTLRKIAAELDCNVTDLLADETSDERENVYICGTTFVCPECGSKYIIEVKKG